MKCPLCKNKYAFPERGSNIDVVQPFPSEIKKNCSKVVFRSYNDIDAQFCESENRLKSCDTDQDPRFLLDGHLKLCKAYCNGKDVNFFISITKDKEKMKEYTCPRGGPVVKYQTKSDFRDNRCSFSNFHHGNNLFSESSRKLNHVCNPYGTKSLTTRLQCIRFDEDNRKYAPQNEFNCKNRYSEYVSKGSRSSTDYNRCARKRQYEQCRPPCRKTKEDSYDPCQERVASEFEFGDRNRYDEQTRRGGRKSSICSDENKYASKNRGDRDRAKRRSALGDSPARSEDSRRRTSDSNNKKSKKDRKHDIDDDDDMKGLSRSKNKKLAQTKDKKNKQGVIDSDDESDPGIPTKNKSKKGKNRQGDKSNVEEDGKGKSKKSKKTKSTENDDKDEDTDKTDKARNAKSKKKKGPVKDGDDEENVKTKAGKSKKSKKSDPDEDQNENDKIKADKTKKSNKKGVDDEKVKKKDSKSTKKGLEKEKNEDEKGKKGASHSKKNKGKDKDQDEDGDDDGKPKPGKSKKSKKKGVDKDEDNEDVDEKSKGKVKKSKKKVTSPEKENDYEDRNVKSSKSKKFRKNEVDKDEDEDVKPGKNKKSKKKDIEKVEDGGNKTGRSKSPKTGTIKGRSDESDDEEYMSDKKKKRSKGKGGKKSVRERDDSDSDDTEKIKKKMNKKMNKKCKKGMTSRYNGSDDILAQSHKRGKKMKMREGRNRSLCLSKSEMEFLNKTSIKRPKCTSSEPASVGRHKDCFSHSGLVPKNMGWMWNITPLGVDKVYRFKLAFNISSNFFFVQLQMVRNHQPGSIAPAVQKLIRIFLENANESRIVSQNFKLPIVHDIHRNSSDLIAHKMGKGECFCRDITKHICNNGIEAEFVEFLSKLLKKMKTSPLCRLQTGREALKRDCRSSTTRKISKMYSKKDIKRGVYMPKAFPRYKRSRVL